MWIERNYKIVDSHKAFSNILSLCYIIPDPFLYPVLPFLFSVKHAFLLILFSNVKEH